MSGSIAFVGDGLTANGRWEEWFQEYGVHNFGVSGDTTDRVIARMDTIVELQPDAISLQIGTNDLGWHRSDEYIVRNIETILWQLRKQLPDVLILVQSVMPRERDYVKTIRSINRHLWQYAPTQKAQYLDLWPAMAQDDGELVAEYTEDGLHLTDAGYSAWTTELRSALEMLFERPPSSSSIPIQRA